MSTTNTVIAAHPFESAGLGKAPFRFVGMIEQDIRYGERILNRAEYEKTGIATTTAPGGSCAYCGTYIRHMYGIESADGRSFHVGSECVNKTGDDHECEGHIHRATYAGDGCQVCDEIMLREFSKLREVNVTIKEIDDLTWAWTTKAMEDLTEISKKAGAASKAATTLHDKLYLRNVQMTAQEGLKTIALVFGKISVQENELNVARAHFDLLRAISDRAGHSRETTPAVQPLLLAGLLALDEGGLAELTPIGRAALAIIEPECTGTASDKRSR